ncbi:MAG: hypothetical protein J7M30_04500 [Deltaproteobacteria bacterium]|nr:hypothetical protein [Deltaproteobacteria bacterium]
MQTQDKDKSKTEEKPKVIVNATPNWPTGLIISKNKNMGVSVAEDLSVVLTKAAFEQLFGWAYATSREISCLGSVLRDGNRFIIEHFHLLKQSGSSVGTELDQSAIAELVEQLLSEGKRQEAGRIKCWAHSHPNMDVFWSNTDDDTCRLLVTDFLISIVVSNSFAIRCRIDIATPVPVVLDNVPVIYQMPKDNLPMDKYAEEVRSTVTERVFSFSKAVNGQDGVEDKLVPETYCGYCGNWHAEGECPLGAPENWPEVLDDSDFMF